MFRIANCSPTGRALCRDFHRNTLIFCAALIFQTFGSHSIEFVRSWGFTSAFASARARYPERVEYSPEGFLRQ